MILLVALIPATGLTVAGYVALFLSHRSEGGLKTFGRYLGIWAFVLAALVVIGGGFAAGHMRAHGAWGPHRGMNWMGRRDGERMWERPEHPETGAMPAKPAAPTPATPAAGGQANPTPPPSR